MSHSAKGKERKKKKRKEEKSDLHLFFMRLCYAYVERDIDPTLISIMFTIYGSEGARLRQAILAALGTHK